MRQLVENLQKNLTGNRFCSSHKNMLLNFAAAMASYSALGQQTPDVADQSSTVDEQESSDEHLLTNPSPADLRPHIHSPTSSGGGQVASSSSSDERLETINQGTKRKTSEVEEGLFPTISNTISHLL